MTTQEVNPEWAIVELMGHKVVAGLVQKSEMLGKPMLRIDIPATSEYPQHTQFYGDAAIYGVTFVSEEVARITAEKLENNPVAVYVPDLVTRERYDNLEDRTRDEIVRLNREVSRLNNIISSQYELLRALPAHVETNEAGEETTSAEVKE